MNLLITTPTILTLLCVSITDIRSRRVPRIIIAVGWSAQLLTLIGTSLLSECTCSKDDNYHATYCAVIHLALPQLYSCSIWQRELLQAHSSHTVQIIIAAILGSVLCAGIQFICAMIKPGALGMGDITTTAVIGLTLGIFGIEAALLWWLFSGLCGLTHLLLLYVIRQIRRKDMNKHTQPRISQVAQLSQTQHCSTQHYPAQPSQTQHCSTQPCVPLSIPYVPDLAIGYILVILLIFL